MLINPKILKFLKRPTRWKAFGVWCIAYAILFSIWAYTFGEPEFAESLEAQKQKAIEEAEHRRYTTAPASTIDITKPATETYWVGPIKRKRTINNSDNSNATNE